MTQEEREEWRRQKQELNKRWQVNKDAEYQSWLKACTYGVGDDVSTSSSDLFRSYCQWCKGRDHRPRSITDWGQWLGVRFVKRRWGAGMVYYGLALRTHPQIEASEI